ncbi:hypothetical protein ACFL0S_03895 [Thermodesulfobacteriota bacterium]
MTLRLMLFFLLIGLLDSASLEASPANQQDMIRVITDQLATVDDPKEKAKLYCYRARNYAKAGEQVKAKDDYFKAINTSYEGWILNELGYFMYKSGEYEKAYNVADKVLTDFPQFNKEATKLKKQAKVKWDEEYLKANPPTITIDTAPDPNRVTRQDFIRQSEARQSTSSNKQTYKGSSSATNSSGGGGSHIRGFGTGSAFRQNYKKSRQGQ